MIEYITNLEDFWSEDLKSYSFPNLVNMKQREYFHNNYARESRSVLQGFDSELPDCYQTFFKMLSISTGLISWICIEPSQVIPVHTDKFFKLRNQHNVDIEDCVRYLIFLEDWVLGHFVEFEEFVIPRWQKGDVWRFDHMSPHCAGNASQTNFITCQVNTIVNSSKRETNE